MKANRLHIRLWDRLGMGISIFCIIHCLLLAALPFWVAISQWHGWFHPLLLLLILPVTVAAVRQNRRGLVPIVMAGGIILLAAGWFWHSEGGGIAETVFTMTGSALLIAGHWQNYRRAHHWMCKYRRQYQ